MADTSDDLRQLARELCEHPPEYVSPDAFRDTLHEAARLARDNPAALTDRHLRHIAVYEPRTVVALVQKRADAQQADRDAAERRRTAPTPAPTPTSDPSAIDLSGVKSIADVAASLADRAARYPHAPATVFEMAYVAAFAAAMNKKNIERNATIVALQKQLADLRVEVDALTMVRS